MLKTRRFPGQVSVLSMFLVVALVAGSAGADGDDEAHLSSDTPLAGPVGLSPLLLQLGEADAGAPVAHLSTSDADCQTASSWASRHRARTRLARHDCTHTLASVNHRMRVSHLRRGMQDPSLYEDRFGTAFHSRSTAPVDETESKLEIAGGHGLWSYETDFDLGREARIDDGRFLPEDRSRLQLKSGLDFGLVRPRVQLEATQREEEQLFARSFATDPGSTSELGGRAFIDLVLPQLPVLTVGAGRAQKEVFRGRRHVGEQVESDVASAALWYGGQGWQAYAVSSRYVFRDDQRPNAEDGLYVDHYLSGSWWPTKTWTVNPSFQYSEATYDGRENWVRTTRASLGLYGTGLWENGLLTFWGGYTKDRDTDRNFHYEQFDLAVGVEHTLGELPALPGYELAVGGTAGVGQYIDHVYTGVSGPAYRTSVTLRLSGL